MRGALLWTRRGIWSRRMLWKADLPGSPRPGLTRTRIPLGYPSLFPIPVRLAAHSATLRRNNALSFRNSVLDNKKVTVYSLAKLV